MSQTDEDVFWELIEELQLEGTIRTKEEALARARDDLRPKT